MPRELVLYNGDCLEVMKDISANSVDLIICDLPYGCLGNDRGKDSVIGNERGIDWDIKIDLEAFWKEVRRIRKDEHTPTLHFCTTKFGYELIQSNPNEFRYDLVWDKQRGVSFLSANKMPMRSHEMIYVFSKAGAFYERKDIEGDFPNTNKGGRPVDTHNIYHDFKDTPKESNEGKRCVLSVIQQSSRMKKGNHPTQKPEDLYRFLIERYCPLGGTVLDPTFGSANSVFTAFSMGRSAIGIEKDEGFFKKALDKLNALL